MNQPISFPKKQDFTQLSNKTAKEESIQLMQAYLKINSPSVRQAIFELVVDLSESKK